MKTTQTGKKLKIMKGCRGAISILLCVLITPFLGIAASLIEFSRYQSTAETLGEILDMSTLSTLSNYDSYVQDRFGLFALSQGVNPTTEFNNNLNNNIGLLNKGISNSGSNTANGSYPLSNLDVLKKQIVDFSESTVLSEVLLKELKIQELLQKLDGLSGLTNLASAASDVANLSSAIKDLVTKGKVFADDIQAAYESAGSITSKIDQLIIKIDDLYKKLCQNGITADSVFDYDNIISTYRADFDAIFESAKSLYDAISGFTNAIGKLPTDYNNFKSAFDTAKTALQKAKDSSESTSNAAKDTSTSTTQSTLTESTTRATDAFESILNALETAITDAASSVQTATIQGIKDAAADLKSDLYSKFKLDFYFHLDDYFSVPLSDQAKSDLGQILSKLPSAWTSNSYDELKDMLKELYAPQGVDFSSFSNTLTNVKGIISDAMRTAEQTFESNLGNKLSEILDALITAVRNLFKLDIFYNGNLNAYLSNSTAGTLLGGQPSPFEKLLEAIEGLFTASQQFVNGLTSFNIFSVIDSVVTLFDSIKLTIQSIVEIGESIVTKVSELVGYVTSGNLSGLYELLLVSAYMTYDLPNRTDSGESHPSVNFINGVTWDTTLNGHALTGFQYENIVVPPLNGGTGLGTLDGLTSFLSGAAGGGTDTMFRGAELEYIVAGTKSEIMNQSITFMELYMLRLILDIAAVFTDPAVASMAGAATIASWAVYLLVLLGEPLCDTVFLVNGEKAPLVKTRCYISPTGLPKLVTKLSNMAIGNETVRNNVTGAINSGINGKFSSLSLPADADFTKDGEWPIDYETHLILMIMFSITEGQMLTRFADLIQLESKAYYTKKGASFTFDINKAYTCITSETTVTYNSFLNIFQFNGTSIFTRTYKKTRGY